MAPPVVSILIPTTGRRADYLARATAAYEEQAARIGPTIEILTVEGFTWGEGLNQLIPQASGEYLLTVPDDVLPWEGWFWPAQIMVDSGRMPASRYFSEAGVPMHLDCDMAMHGAPVAWCRSFLLTPAIFETVGSFIDATWWTDVDYSERLAAAGWPIVGCDGYGFTHLDAPRDWQVGDWEERERGEYQASHARRGWGGG